MKQTIVPPGNDFLLRNFGNAIGNMRRIKSWTNGKQHDLLRTETCFLRFLLFFLFLFLPLRMPLKESLLFPESLKVESVSESSVVVVEASSSVL